MTDICATCEKNYEACDSYPGHYTEDRHGNIITCDKYRMSEKEAKRIILQDPAGNIVKRLEAVVVARSILGDDCTMAEIYKWAERG